MLWCGLALAALAVVPLSGCGTTYPRRDPGGETFPSVQAEDLDGRAVTVPDDFAGAPLLLLVGYVQDAQFDADRWLLGALQAEVDIAVRELPTIPAFFPRMFLQETIDSGMRAGIPSEDWGAVITVYDDGDKVAEFTGNERGRNIRVLLLDGAGKVVWFHDRGYSAGKMMELMAAIEALKEG